LTVPLWSAYPGMSVRIRVGGYFRKVGGQRTFCRGKILKSRCSEM
jgi:hypothetical protein